MSDAATTTPLPTRIRWTWDFGPEFSAADSACLLTLLAALREHGTLGKAALTAGTSYRAAWGLLRRGEEGFGKSLVLKPVDVPTLTAAKALELWAVPTQGAPRSLGLVSPERGATVLRAGLLQGTAAFAVSLEPAGGSPTGAPTGPILSVGKVQI